LTKGFLNDTVNNRLEKWIVLLLHLEHDGQDRQRVVGFAGIGQGLELVTRL
jgi:hypothetical protein